MMGRIALMARSPARFSSLRGGPRTSWLPRRAPRRSSRYHNSEFRRRPCRRRPSLRNVVSLTTHPMASFAAPLTSSIELATVFSFMAGLPYLSPRRVTALGFEAFASGTGTLGERSESRQPRKLLTPGCARPRRRIERSNRMTARRRGVRQSRPCSCQARSSLSKGHRA